MLIWSEVYLRLKSSDLDPQIKTEFIHNSELNPIFLSFFSVIFLLMDIFFGTTTNLMETILDYLMARISGG